MKLNIVNADHEVCNLIDGKLDNQKCDLNDVSDPDVRNHIFGLIKQRCRGEVEQFGVMYGKKSHISIPLTEIGANVFEKIINKNSKEKGVFAHWTYLPTTDVCSIAFYGMDENIAVFKKSLPKKKI